MRLSSHAIISALFAILLFAGGFLLGRRTVTKPKPEVRTVIRTMTATTVVNPYAIIPKPPRFVDVVRHDTVYFTTIRHDSVLVDVPIEKKVYAEDSLYRAVVSGWRPSLDSLTVYPKITTIKITETIKTPPPRLSLGVTAGPSVLATPSGRVHGGLGVTAGVSFRF